MTANRNELHEKIAILREAFPDTAIYEEYRDDDGDHPASFVDFECAFAAAHLARILPSSILDIGSYRQFIIGLLAAFSVTTLDVRERKAASSRETVMTGDASALPFDDGSFPAIVSLCAVEHFGLGRYGDPFDPHGDMKAFAEMKRVCAPGGEIIFTTTFTAAHPSIAMNAHRIYTHCQIQELCAGLEPVEEKIYSHRYGEFRPLADAIDLPRAWDVYCGCWRKSRSSLPSLQKTSTLSS